MLLEKTFELEIVQHREEAGGEVERKRNKTVKMNKFVHRLGVNVNRDLESS